MGQNLFVFTLAGTVNFAIEIKLRADGSALIIENHEKEYFIDAYMIDNIRIMTEEEITKKLMS